MAMPVGPLKLAAEPLPSAEPVTPALPANVLTVPSLAILRIVLLPVSVT